jgi:penicillin amidase
MKVSSRRRAVRIGEFQIDACRTPEGVMQLWADDDLALAAGLGWAHARDRLVQMVLLRLVGQGRLAECLQSTEETVGIDVWARDMGFARDVVADEELVSDQARRVAEAYAAGVNEVLTRRRRPFELLLVGHRPEPWRLADVLLTIKIMTYVGLAQTQVDFEKLLVQALRGGVAVDALRRLVSPHLDGLDDATVEQLRQLRWVAPLLPPAVRFATAAARASASNNWAVAASRSASGSALLASDPHMEINRLPALWYETVLHTRDDYRIGITMPGVPGLVMGRTSRIAFGFTYGFMDMVDFFVDEVRGSAVRRGESWVPLAVRQEDVRRKGAEPVVVTLRESSLGVLEADPLQPELEDGLYLTRAWSAQRAGAAPSLDAIARMLLALSVIEAQAVLRSITISCNWWSPTATAHRLPAVRVCPIAPTPGSTGAGRREANRWRGRVDPARLLSILNPAEGFLATANHELNPPGGPLAVNLPMGSYRHDRICAVLAATERATLDDLKRLQNDVYSLHAERFMALLGPLLPSSPAAELLRRWDCRYDRDSRGATVFEKVYHALLARVFGDGLFGAEAWRAIVEETTVLTDYYHLFDNAILGGDPFWFGAAGREAVLRQVLEQSLASIDVAAVPRWGSTRLVMLTDIFFGGKLPRWLGFDRGPIELAGNRATVVQGGIFTAHNRHTTFAPSWRMVTDLGRDETHTALAGGPTGSRFSRHRLSDLERWLTGEYKVLKARI